MVLVDTSVWVEHFRQTHVGLAGLLTQGHVLAHPFVLGELACGNMRNRAAILSNLSALGAAKVASHTEVTRLLEDRKLWRRGLGWIDVHLLASALLSNCRLWTFDKRLADAAGELGLN